MIDFDPYVYWFIFGVVLMILELIVPGVFLLCIGFASLLTGVFCWLVPAWPFAVFGMIFAVLSVVFAFLGQKIISSSQEKTQNNTLNNRMEIYVGKTYPVTGAIVDGRGKIAVEDTVWNAISDTNIPVGTTVKVTGFEGTALKVSPLND